MALQEYLDQEIKKVCPIHGISFGKLDDKSTWRIDYAKEATEKQKTSAQEMLIKFHWTDSDKKDDETKQKIKLYKDNLPMKQGFIDYKRTNPQAAFIDYINYLENLQV
jgi:hypothetical protein